MHRRSFLIGMLLAGGCVRDSTVVCGDLLCPPQFLCVLGGCVSPAEFAACDGKQDGDSCTVSQTTGTCDGGRCVEPLCGDAMLSPSEICDDGNTDGGDGCSQRCDSTERCGNLVVDVEVGEQCDVGVPGLSRDGCSSGCAAELVTWRDVSPHGVRSRHHAASAYDSDRRRVVLFGGAGGGSVPDGTTWEWEGTWFEVRSATVPTPRAAAGMAYDRARHRTVMFGGRTSSFQAEYATDPDALAETWEWDGVDWQLRSPPNSPPARSGAQLAYDTIRGRVVLFGGAGPQGLLGDTWEWDGTTWTELHPASSPSPRVLHGIGFAGSETVVFGGYTQSGSSAETWTWDGTSWTQRVTPGPSARFAAPLAWHAIRARLVLFGGWTSLQDTWEWNPTTRTWAQVTTAAPVPRGGAVLASTPAGAVLLHAGASPGGYPVSTSELTGPGNWASRPTPAPAVRYGAAATFDRDRGVGIMFGGLSSAPVTDSWRWDGLNWRPLADTGVIPRLPLSQPQDYALVYDDARRRVHLFGGDATGVGTNWSISDTGWTALPTTASPPARYGHAMAYDRVRQRVVLVGGRSATTNLELADLWEYDGVTWTNVTPPNMPSLAFASATYDVARSRVAVFGGDRNQITSNRLYTWDGTTWLDVTPTATPSPRARSRALLEYEPRTRVLVLFGGLDRNDYLDDTWQWNGTRWTSVPVVNSPSARYATASFYDPIRGAIVAFSGLNENVEIGTWAYSYESIAEPADLCASFDTDGDSLIGCLDPDCWGRCDPYCPPQSGGCAAGRPHCGDGTCSATENWRICSDCAPP